MTRTSNRWQSLPGSFDALHAQQLFRTDNRWGIPCLETTPLAAVPKELFAYKSRRVKPADLSSVAIHFFLDDYRFEGVWNRPNNALHALTPFLTLLTPDFSLYTDWPLSLQLWNTYRSRWCGAFWQQHGFNVIPTISWSDEESFAFCFSGVPQHSVRVDFDNLLEYTLFTAGVHTIIAAKLSSLFYQPLQGQPTAVSEVHMKPTIGVGFFYLHGGYDASCKFETDAANCD